VVEKLVNNELEGMGREVAVAYFEVQEGLIKTTINIVCVPAKI
jgi:hypothetical protein